MRAKHLALLGMTLAAFAVAPARASCAAPEVSIRPTTATPGDRLVVRGRYWDDICDDTGGSSCLGGNDGFDSRPTQDISIRLQPSKGEAIALAEADADDDLRFAVQVQLPEDLAPGQYRVVANGTRSDVLIIERT